jgi:hypothetical protein
MDDHRSGGMSDDYVDHPADIYNKTTSVNFKGVLTSPSSRGSCERRPAAHQYPTVDQFEHSVRMEMVSRQSRERHQSRSRSRNDQIRTSEEGSRLLASMNMTVG